MMLPSLLLSLFCFSHVYSKMILRDTCNHATNKHYAIGKRASQDSQHDIMISIKQLNINYLKEVANNISNPFSPNYGEFLSFEEVGAYVQNSVATAAVLSWLTENSIDIVDQTEYGDYIFARSTVSTFEKLFNATFHEFKRLNVNEREVQSSEKILRALSYSLPEHLDEHIHAVHQLSSLPPVMYQSNAIKPLNLKEVKSRKLNILSPLATMPDTNIVTPAVLAMMYNIYNVASSDDYGSQSVYGKPGSTYLQSDIDEFQSIYTDNAQTIISNLEPIPDSEICTIHKYYYYSSAKDKCASPSVSLEYITSTAANTPTSFYYDATDNIIGWVVNVTNMAHPPLVNVIPAWTYEVFISNSDLNVFDAEAVKLSVRGVTIIAASGDSGVTGIRDVFVDLTLYILQACFDIRIFD